MKNYLRIAVIAVACLIGASSANAQFRFGPKLGVCINSLKFDNVASNFDSDNRAGFTGGVTAEFTVPFVGQIGADASLMYVNRSSKWANPTAADGEASVKHNLDYIDIPVNFKWKFGIPGLGNVLSPYLATGPDFAFLCNKDIVKNVVEGESVSISWNIGVGVELFNRLQIGASYGIGLNKAVKYVNKDINTIDIDGKNKYWTVSAAWLFSL